MTVLSTALTARNREVREGVNQTHYFMFAARPALDWIAKALPWIVEKAGETRELLKRIRTEEDPGAWKKEIPNLEEDLETLTALIAQAEGTEVK